MRNIVIQPRAGCAGCAGLELNILPAFHSEVLILQAHATVNQSFCWCSHLASGYLLSHLVNPQVLWFIFSDLLSGLIDECVFLRVYPTVGLSRPCELRAPSTSYPPSGNKRDEYRLHCNLVLSPWEQGMESYG